MPKFRLLTLEELQELQKEFIEYLIVKGISSSDWVRLKERDPHAAERMLELFSDVVFASILRNVAYIENRGKNYLHVFHCLPDEIVLVAMEVADQDEIDFTNPDFITSSMLTPPDSLHVYTTQKPYAKEREMEIFDMLQAGCTITDDKLYKALCLAL